MRSYWKIKLWAKFVNHFDVFDNLWSRKTQCDRSIGHYIVLCRFAGLEGILLRNAGACEDF